MKFGELAEWLNAAVLKTVKDASPSGVRIPDSPHISYNSFYKNKLAGQAIMKLPNMCELFIFI